MSPNNSAICRDQIKALVDPPAFSKPTSEPQPSMAINAGKIAQHQPPGRPRISTGTVQVYVYDKANEDPVCINAVGTCRKLGLEFKFKQDSICKALGIDTQSYGRIPFQKWCSDTKSFIDKPRPSTKFIVHAGHALLYRNNKIPISNLRDLDHYTNLLQPQKLATSSGQETAEVATGVDSGSGPSHHAGQILSMLDASVLQAGPSGASPSLLMQRPATANRRSPAPFPFSSSPTLPSSPLLPTSWLPSSPPTSPPPIAQPSVTEPSGKKTRKRPADPVEEDKGPVKWSRRSEPKTTYMNGSDLHPPWLQMVSNPESDGLSLSGVSLVLLCGSVVTKARHCGTHGYALHVLYIYLEQQNYLKAQYVDFLEIDTHDKKARKNFREKVANEIVEKFDFGTRLAEDSRECVYRWFKNRDAAKKNNGNTTQVKIAAHAPATVQTTTVGQVTTQAATAKHAILLLDTLHRLTRKRNLSAAQLWAETTTELIRATLQEEQDRDHFPNSEAVGRRSQIVARLFRDLPEEERKGWETKAVSLSRESESCHSTSKDIYENQEVLSDALCMLLGELVGSGYGQIGEACFSLRAAYKTRDGLIDHFDISIGTTRDLISFNNFKGGPSAEEDDRWCSFYKQVLAQTVTSRNVTVVVPTLPSWDPTWPIEATKLVLQNFIKAHWEYAHRTRTVAPAEVSWARLADPSYGLSEEWITAGLDQFVDLDHLATIGLYSNMFRAQNTSHAFMFNPPAVAKLSVSEMTTSMYANMTPSSSTGMGTSSSASPPLVDAPSVKVPSPTTGRTSSSSGMGPSASSAPLPLAIEAANPTKASSSSGTEPSLSAPAPVVAPAVPPASSSSVMPSTSESPSTSLTPSAPVTTIVVLLEGSKSASEVRPEPAEEGLQELKNPKNQEIGPRTSSPPDADKEPAELAIRELDLRASRSPSPPAQTIPAASSSLQSAAVTAVHDVDTHHAEPSKNLPDSDTSTPATILPAQRSPRRTRSRAGPKTAEASSGKKRVVVESGKGWDYVISEDEDSGHKEVGVGGSRKRKCDVDEFKEPKTAKRGRARNTKK
ncbi:hypothetical protein EUX98_g9036 [Antrodiella citrinella]|uniref:Uncharacterized protein n=1 Tax=Antrodiella citrinella TaxID=2447956 RepID=A0A4S4M0V7_9APHY|nr:hypothetical protein EUX98_g9036 [Antrodiella citrinella]